ncbi:MAG: cyclic nucleotide-binding domain-containing protein [Oleispira antarctica]|uniref:Cyclic nucleotide-binding protein n=1 Tax=Oleispira antarctica RB-8 TaxID=698738 RepID=R4YLA8_OLEAN|nr:cyclic nucleotide-binding domain-containing protein [Oleispira antarctica]MBQ0792889.1 cyclic nucleotide-binding domain-containing protein [Oleispira antarctica]CCK75466.1 Cyclic nucleotide-binding protein [Oleispira antarctica RB-8]
MTTSSSINSKQLKGFIPFDYLTAACIEDLTNQFRVHTLEKGKILFKRGNKDNECHFLISGDIDLADENFNITKVAANSDDNYLALDNSSHIHRTSAITTSPCQFYSINRDYLDLVTTWSQLSEELEEQDPDLNASDALDWMDALLTSPLFTRIPPANIQKLLARFTERDVKIGEIIVKEEAQGQEFYVIKSGRAIVTQGYGHKEKVLAAIQTGHCFGEDALIAESVRNATVTMASNGTLMVLDKVDFDELLKKPIIKSISMEELHIQMDEGDSGTVLIDVRRPQEFRHDPLKNSENVPLNHIREKLNTMNHDFHYVVYCDGGRRSEVAAYIMTESGFNAVCLTR